MPPFGFNFFNKIEEKRENSPEEIISIVITENPEYHKDSIEKLLSPDMLSSVEDFISKSYDKKGILKLVHIFYENGKLANLESVARLNIERWIREDLGIDVIIFDTFAKINIDLKTEGVIREVNAKIIKWMKSVIIFDTFADFLEMIKRHSIPIDIKNIESTININFLKERLKVRQITGINKLLAILSDIGITFEISECLNEIKEGIVYSFREDYYDKRFVDGLTETLNLVKGTRIENDVKDFLAEKLDIQSGEWRGEITDESKNSIRQAVFESK